MERREVALSWFKTHPRMARFVVLIMATLLYVLGLTVVYLPVAVAVLVAGFRFPQFFRSMFSRVIISIFVVYSTMQIAAIMQFALLPNSGFRTIALFTSAILLLLLFMLPAEQRTAKRKQGGSIISRTDGFALLAAAFTVVPLLLFILLGSGAQFNKLGGIQGIDGVNHFALIAEMGNREHLTYAPGNYYPKSFHLSTAFVQESFGIHQDQFSWINTARIYTAQYAVQAGLLLLTLFYFAASLLGSAKFKGSHALAELTTAICIGSVVTVFYFTGFLYHGFLSYFYIIATIIAGGLYLLSDNEQSNSATSRAVIFLLLSFGASVSWPLLTPALLLSGLLYVLSTLKSLKDIWTSWKGSIFILSATLLHFIPIYYQVTYTVGDTSQGINLTGGLKIFHIATLLAGIGILAYIAMKKNSDFSDNQRQSLVQLCAPLFIMVLALLAMQYFKLGEPRYYAIKTALLVELLTITLASVLVVQTFFKESGKSSWYSVWLLPFVVGSATALLIAFTGNPLLEARQLLRSYSSEQKPPFFDEDAEQLSVLGEQNQVSRANTISMHVNPEGKLFTHSQIYFWTDVIEYSGSLEEQRDLSCAGQIYGNLFSQDYSPTNQEKLVNKIKECAQKAKSKGLNYNIVTDDLSEGRLRELFGNSVRLY